MGEWVVGAFINLFGSIAINFGTNLLKLGHNEVWLKLLFSACIRLLVGRVAQLVELVELVELRVKGVGGPGFKFWQDVKN
jgi:hypothetical protein